VGRRRRRCDTTSTGNASCGACRMSVRGTREHQLRRGSGGGPWAANRIPLSARRRAASLLRSPNGSCRRSGRCAALLRRGISAKPMHAGVARRRSWMRSCMRASPSSTRCAAPGFRSGRTY
jgi:hypothetical protein